jgi:prevent-host-death family protein
MMRHRGRNCDAGSVPGFDKTPILAIEGDRRDFGDRGQIGGRAMARTIRRSGVKQVPLSEIKDDLSRYLREAETQEIVITRHGKPAGVLIGFESEEDWFEYRLENDPRFLRRIEQARESLRTGRGVRLEDIERE